MAANNNKKAKTIASSYSVLEADRQPFLERARECAKLTIPSLLPEAGHTATNDLPTPYQSVGARGVNHLGSKLLTTMLPPNAPFFKLNIPTREIPEGKKGDAEYVLSQIERRCMDEIETKSLRVPIFEGIKQLLVSGNVLLFIDPRTSIVRAFRLDRYVVVRDPMGTVIKIITKETVSPSVLSDKIIKHCFPECNDVNEWRQDSTHKSIDMYTGIERRGNRFRAVQEINGVDVPGTVKFYPVDRCPWIALRYTRIDGESYGRGLVEEFFGDLRSAETLSRAIVQGAQASAKILMLVHPNGTTKVSELQKARNGDFVYGSTDEVQVLQINKQGDFGVAQNLLQSLEQRLAAAFLLSSAVQRNAERVTAEEVRYMANELESALGGTYTLLAQELQLPLVRILLNSLEARGEIPAMPDGLVKPQITTGLDALGRATDLNRLAQFLKYLEPLGEEVIQQEVNLNDYINRLAASIGIETAGLIKSDEQKKQEAEQQQQQMQQQQMMEMAQRAAPQVAGAMTKGQMNG